jgi:hypothetical protein
MKNRVFAMVTLLIMALAALPASCARGTGASQTITRDALVRSLGRGNSLCVVHVIEKRTTDTQPRRGFFIVQAQALRLLVPGDLSMPDLSHGLAFLAGTPYVDRLEKDGIYALFLDRDGPTSISWAFRDDLVKFASVADPAIEALARQAKTIYRQTEIHRFREARVSPNPRFPKLPTDVIQACDRFRASRGNRVALARRIWKSPLGADRKLDRSNRFSSVRRFVVTKPQVAINRSQALCLLGEPTFKHGFVYIWECGGDPKGIEVLQALIPHAVNRSIERRPYRGILSIGFDANGNGGGVIYDVYIPGQAWGGMAIPHPEPRSVGTRPGGGS